LRSAWNAQATGIALEAKWQHDFNAYAKANPELAAEFLRVTRRELPGDWPELKQSLHTLAKGISAPTASRKSSQQMLDLLVAGVPELLGGSADLTGSNLTAGKTSRAWHDHQDGDANYLSYGVREFGMAAIMNGVVLHGGLIPYGGTFAVFSDYARNGMRMSALMRQRVIYVLTHDSIGLGEDGPTHQPIEHAASLRLIPGLDLWRPCDGMETAVAWTSSIERHDGPSALMLSRQNLPQVSGAIDPATIAKGGYVLSDCDGTPEAVLIAAGSEVMLAMEAQQTLKAQGRQVRVVSMPCTARFDAQSIVYQQQVLRKYVGLSGAVIGIARFGESAPAAQVYDTLGITSAQIVAAV
jgi:transketolase